MKISSSSTDTPPPKRSSSFLNTATEAELEKPGTLPEMNEYRLSVAATRHPGYIEWIVLPIGRTFAGGKIMSGSGTASSLSSLTIAFSSMSAPRGPTTLIIATPSGAQPLTLPVVRDGVGHTPMGEVRLSDHGDWRHLHWNALASAYEGSPYFEYYADDFRPLYEHPFEYLADFNAALHNVVLSLLSLTPSVEVSRDYVAEVPAGAADLRNLVSPKVPIEHDAQFRVQPYYQVFKERTGFLPNLSIVDLLFNMGPESRMVHKQSLI